MPVMRRDLITVAMTLNRKMATHNTMARSAQRGASRYSRPSLMNQMLVILAGPYCTSKKTRMTTVTPATITHQMIFARVMPTTSRPVSRGRNQ